MNVAFIDVYNRTPIASGGDWWMFQLFADLARNNSLSTFYTSEKSSEEGYLPKDIGFDTHFLPSRVKWSRLSTWLEILRPDVLWDKAQIRDIKADLVFTTLFGYHIAAYIAKKNEAPVILVMPDVGWQYIKSLGSLWYLPALIYENWILNRVDAIITISLRDTHYVAKHTSRRVFHIPPKPDPHIFTPNGDRYDFGSDSFNVLFYGSLDRYQNRVALTFIKNKLIPALGTQRFGTPVRVHVFGSGKVPDGMLSGADVNFIGAVSDPGLYIRGADAIIVPIRNASGMKLRTIESLACGKHVVATSEAVEGLPDELKAMVYVVDTAADFAKTLKGIADGTLANKSNPSVVMRQTLEDTLDDAINYVSKK
jgi:glycosyltransferase involved in cell wall biosynthesis